MASVTSLDHDMRNLRMSRYTVAAANEARTWIEDTTGEKLPAGDLCHALKDGTVLCKLVNLILPGPGVKYKQSSMPFVQMENISQFLRACEGPPMHMPAHDRFLTVDLYESKDPAQVLQCLGAFSRVANSVDPARFPSTIGPRKITPMSPSSTGVRSSNTSPYVTSASFSRPQSTSRPMSPMKTGGSTASGSNNTGFASPTSTWSNKGDENHTSPAWNIMQYGYMGGASQNNQGISFGGRRQITSAGSQIPNSSENDRRRKEQAAEEERLRVLAEKADRQKRLDLEAEEEQARVEEARRWEDETKRLREQERTRLAEQKRQWEEEERKWKAEEEARQIEQADMNKRLSKQLGGTGATIGTGTLRGQFLSQYQAEQSANASKPEERSDTPEGRQVRELQKQLQEAKDRERQYQMEREERHRAINDRSHPQLAQQAAIPGSSSPKESDVSWTRDPLESSQVSAHARGQIKDIASTSGSTRPLPVPVSRPSTTVPEPQTPRADTPTHVSPPRPENDRPSSGPQAPYGYGSSQDGPAARSQPVSQPQALTQSQQSSVDRYLADNPAPQFDVRPSTHVPDEMRFSSTLEEQAEKDRRIASQQQTKAGGWASKSILEREMERERERQREWEAEQQTARPARPAGARPMGPRPPPS